jgi:hypothetical protein
MATLNYALSFGILIFFLLVTLFLGIRLRILSPGKAAIVMFLFPIVFETVGVFLQKGEPVQILCAGTILSLSLGSTTYVFGRALEGWVSKQKK